VNLSFQYNLTHFPLVSDRCFPVFFIPITFVLFNLIFSYFTWSSSFNCSFYSHHCNLFWDSLVLHSFNMTYHLNRWDFINFTVQCFIWLNPNHMCDVSVTIAAVTNEHCPCDVSCRLAMDQERLQGSFLQTDMRTLLKFQIWYYESTYKASLKEIRI